ncbi:hypothetical protein [Phaffia rhodozyma]|uniref:Uncharacterized protein n=1 Tax=Phaffia rhodozyma TaxID=264483 RepID=A0A0F7SUV1_PHARH|nr:hypothetical protein [Phaffia rhodozyma]
MAEGLYPVDNISGQEAPEASHVPSVEIPKRNLFKAFRSNKSIIESTPISTEPSDPHHPPGSVFSQTPSPTSESSLSLKAENPPIFSFRSTNKVIRIKRAELPGPAQDTVDTKAGETGFREDLDATLANVVPNWNRSNPTTQSTSSLSRSGSLDGSYKPDSSKPVVPPSPKNSVRSDAASSQELTESKIISRQSSQITTTGSSGSTASLTSSSERAPSSFKWVSVMSTPSTNPRMLGPSQVPTFDPDHPLLPTFGCQRYDLSSTILLATPLWKKELNDSAGKVTHRQSIRARFSSNKVEWKNRVLVLTSWTEELADPSATNKVQKVLLGYLHLFKTNASTTREIGRMKLDAESEVGPLDGENPCESDTDGRTNVLNVMLSRRPKKGTKRTWGVLGDTLTVQFETGALLQNWIHEINSFIFVKRAESVGLGETAREYRSKHYPLTGDLSLALANIFEKSLKSLPRSGHDTAAESFRDSPIPPMTRQLSSSAESSNVSRPLYPQIVQSPEFNEFGSRTSYKPTTTTEIITRPVLVGSSNPRVSHLAASATAPTGVSLPSSKQSKTSCYLMNEPKTSGSGSTRERSSANDSLEGSLRHSDSIWARELEIERLKRTEVELRAELELERLKSVERQLRAELMQERKRNEKSAIIHPEAVLDGSKPIEQCPSSVGDSEDRTPKVPSSRRAPGRKRSSAIQSETSSYYFDSQGGRRPSDGISYTSEDYVPSTASPSSSIHRQTSKMSLSTCYSGLSAKNTTNFGVSFPSRDIEENGGLPSKEESLYQVPSIRFAPPTSLIYLDSYSTSPTSMGNVDASSTTDSPAQLPIKGLSLPTDFNHIDRPYTTTGNRQRSSSTTATVARRGSDHLGSSPLSTTSPSSALPASNVNGWNDLYDVQSFPYRRFPFPHARPPPPPGPAPMCSLPPLPPLLPLSVPKTE